MRIGILTFHRSYNCGALLQAWALRRTLEKFGNSVDFPTGNRVQLGSLAESSGGLSLRVVLSALKNLLRRKHRQFRSKNLPEKECGPEQFSGRYDLVVVGSDQVWNEVNSGPDLPLFLGENVGAEVRLVAYAVSCGDSFSRLKTARPDVYKRILAAVGRFVAVSVREQYVAELLSKDSKKDIAEVADPTFLLDAAEYDEIDGGGDCSSHGEYLFVYTLSTDKRILSLAKKLAGELGVRCVIATPDPRDAIFDLCVLKHYVSPQELVHLIKCARFVVSVSFHGTALSIIFRKNFLVLRLKPNDFESRPAALLKKFECADRLADVGMTVEELKAKLCLPVNNYNDIMQSYRDKSLAWLKTALGCI